MKIIDLSQTIHEGMPGHHTQPPVGISPWSFHEGNTIPSALMLQFSEHTGTHVDALSHMLPDKELPSIDRMSLENFIGEGLCLDVSRFEPGEFIEVSDLKQAIDCTSVVLEQVNFVLLYTDHLRKNLNTSNAANNPGLSEEAALWLCKSGVKAFGVDAFAPGVKSKSNKRVHEICGETGVTHYENLTNLHELVGKGIFTFIGFPLKIQSGTGSPVRAVALLQED